MRIVTLLILLFGSSCVESSSSRIGSPYTFWKTTKLQLLPQTEHLITSVRGTILTYFRTGLVKLPKGSGDYLRTAKTLYQVLNITLVPDDRILDTEKHTSPQRFLKRVLKQNFARQSSFLRLVTKEKTFRCRIKDQVSKYICTSMTDIAANMDALIEILKSLLSDTLKMKKVPHSDVLKIERRLSSTLRKGKAEDEDDIGEDDAENHIKEKHRSYDLSSYPEDVATLRKPYTRKYTARNKASVVVLYALFRHLQETAAELQYALKVL